MTDFLEGKCPHCTRVHEFDVHRIFDVYNHDGGAMDDECGNTEEIEWELVPYTGKETQEAILIDGFLEDFEYCSRCEDSILHETKQKSNHLEIRCTKCGMIENYVLRLKPLA